MTIGGTLAGVAGAALAIDLGIFQQNLTNAQGFIAIALVYFGAWRPLGVMLRRAALRIRQLARAAAQDARASFRRVGRDIAAMAPAVITILALVVVASRFRQPAALTKPFTRGT